MDYLKMTAPCGLDCFNCHFFLAREDREAMNTVEKLSEEHNIPVEVMLCNGCRAHDGQIPLQKHVFGEAHRCAAYECSKEKGINFCGDCEQFPCDNLCLINKMGLEKWAESKALEVRKDYFNKPWTLT